jgi:hypothetical protein
MPLHARAIAIRAETKLIGASQAQEMVSRPDVAETASARMHM